MSTSTCPAPIVHEQTDNASKVCPNYNVILLNDDYHSFEFVWDLLQEIFKKDEQEAFALTHKIHHEDRAIIVTCSKERAELYLDQVKTMPEGKKGPLGCEMEPAE